MTATTIKIVMTRMNTFGDEVFGDPNVLKSYFYAISDFAIGGRWVNLSWIKRVRARTAVLIKIIVLKKFWGEM